MHEKKHFDFLFPLLLFIGLLISATLLIGYQAMDIRKQNEIATTQENLNVSLAYIKNKVNQTSGPLHIVLQDGIDCLVLEEQRQDIKYLTYLYVWQNSLCELYIQEGLPLHLEDGTMISSIQKASFQIRDQLLTVTLDDALQNHQTIQIYFTER